MTASLALVTTPEGGGTCGSHAWSRNEIMVTVTSTDERRLLRQRARRDVKVLDAHARVLQRYRNPVAICDPGLP